METRNERIKRLYNSGITLSAIGNLESVSRQRIWQIVNDVKQDDLKYKKLRYFILVRDGHTCKWNNICGGIYNKMPLKKREQYMTVHHLDGNHGNNNRKNLITLCKSCHSEFHAGEMAKKRWLLQDK